MAVIVGCSDDPSNPYAGEKTMTITSADVEFSPLGGTGTVVVNAPNGITGVESAASWATASVSGNTITVNVAENPRVEGRSARLIIKSQSESIYVVIQQNGVDFIFDALPQINADRDGETFNFLTKSNVPFTVESDVDWITTIVELGTVKVVVAKNETYKERSGNIICKAGGTTKTTTIKQAAQISPADKMKGDYYLWYYASSTWNSIDFTLEQIEDENWQIRFTEGEYAEKGIIIPVKVDIEAGKMTIQNLMTIQGDGTLNAISNGYSAGIGGGYNLSCGNISIKGGNIIATAGDASAGVGSGSDASCGDITIIGGNVTATGGDFGAGIGAGFSEKCMAVLMRRDMLMILKIPIAAKFALLTRPYVFALRLERST